MGRRALVVIGNFDGVHRGHQDVIREASRLAAERELDLKMLTFEPHPAAALGRTAPALLTRLPRKIELARRVDASLDVVVEPFDRTFAAIAPDEFAERVLFQRLGASVVVVGKNFRFGKDRAGDFARLVELGRSLGFDTRPQALFGDDAGPWSSTRVRAALAQGNLDEVTTVLGRPHMISGVVREGDRLGRTLGFPTANLHYIEEALPPHGVYAVLVDRVEDRAAALAKGVMNIGVRPTVSGERALRVEVHLFDFEGDLYGATLRVHIVKHLRDEQRFPDLSALRAQIEHDAVAARGATEAAVPQDHGAFF